MKYCSHCGQEVMDEAVVCVHCGASLETNSTQNQSNYNQGNQSTQAFQPQKTNGLCIAGFIISFFSGLIGLILSIVGLVQVNKNPNEKGRGLGIAGIILGAIGLVCQIIAIVNIVNNILTAAA